jgi:hypothetical protein
MVPFFFGVPSMFNVFELLERWSSTAASVVDRYSRKNRDTKTMSLFDDEGNASKWITIGGEPGADGKRHGGHPVKVSKDGTMLTGHFAGKKLDEAFGDKKPEGNSSEKPDSSGFKPKLLDEPK